MARRLFIYSGCLVLFFFANFAQALQIEQAQAQAGNLEALVDALELKQADLEPIWQKTLPLEANEKVSKIYVTDKLLFVSTDQNYFYALNRKKGVIDFIVQPASARQPLLGPTFYDGKLLFMVGKKTLVLDPALKSITKSKKLDILAGTAVSAPARNTDIFYVAAEDKRLYVLNSDDYVKKFTVTADNDSMINSIIADDEFLVFSTNAGNIVSMDPDSTDRRWQRDVGGLKAPLKREGQWLYVSTTKAKVSKINIATSKSGWLMDFVAGEKLTTPVTIGKKLIYQYAGKKGLYAIDKQTGKQLWQNKQAKGLLAESGPIAYIFEKPGQLTVINNEKNKKLYSVDISNVDIFGNNTVDEKIYLSDSSGRIMAIGVIKSNY